MRPQIPGVSSRTLRGQPGGRLDTFCIHSIDPLGVADIGSRTFYYEAFLKGVSKPNQVQAWNLALEVLAMQSGGLVLKSGNDVAAQ